jgi:hypothetical protein
MKLAEAPLEEHDLLKDLVRGHLDLAEALERDRPPRLVTLYDLNLLKHRISPVVADAGRVLLGLVERNDVVVFWRFLLHVVSTSLRVAFLFWRSTSFQSL